MEGPGDAGEAVGPVEWGVDSEPVVSIGELEGDSAYLFSRIAAVRLLPDGRIAVADGASGTIRIYGRDGVFQRRMGGSGQGPGEFRYISDLSIMPPDTIVAYDSRALRLTNFLSTGELVSTYEFRASDGRPEVYLGQYSDGSHAVAWIRQAPRDPSVVTADAMQLGQFGADGRLARVLGTEFGMRRLGAPLPFSPHFLGAMIGDTIYHTDGLSGVVEATGPAGEAVRTLRVALDEWALEDARSLLEAELDSADVQRLHEVEGPGIDSIPTIADVLADGEGRLWLKGYNPSTDSHWIGRQRTGGEWLVIEADGEVVARVSIPRRVRLMDISGDHIVGVSRDEMDVERVQVFALVREE